MVDKEKNRGTEKLKNLNNSRPKEVFSCKKNYFLDFAFL